MFSKYHLSENAKIITNSISGEESLKLLEIQEKVESNNISYPRGIPIAFDLAEGAIIQDVDGNQYIDFLSSCSVFNLGHNNPDIIDDLKKIQDKIMQAVDFPTKVKMDFIENLLDILPESLKGKCKINFGGPTGSDAVETALKLARINTGRHTVIAFHGGYHGMTMGALSVTSKLSHREKTIPLIPGVHFMPFCSSYRCPFKKSKENCEEECLKYFKYVLENPSSGIDKPGAIIIEPVQGEGGTYIPSKGWLEKITNIARKNNVLVIFDEIQAGFYRTGKLFSFEHTRAIPDIVVMSKGIGGIGFPLSLIIYNKTLDKWDAGTHIGTFRGNQLGMAAGVSAMKFVKNMKLELHVEKLGKEMFNSLKSLKNNSRFIGDVRGIGMMFGIEYVKDKKSKDPFPKMAQNVRKACYENGLLVEVGGHYNNVIRFLPPLIITPKIANNGLAIFKKANDLAEKKYDV
jgi:diaminobutyrate-2-oxoglutarate transaminase